MDRAISASEANQQFSRVLREVADGESYTVMSRGKPVARIVPIERPPQGERLNALLDEWAKKPIRFSGPWKRDDLYE